MTFDLDLWPFDCSKMWRFPCYINGSSRTSTFQMRPFSYFQPILQLDLRWPLTLVYKLWPYELRRVPYYINKLSLVPIGLQLFKWGHFHIFNLLQLILRWPLTLIWPFDLVNKWGFLFCIWPNLVWNPSKHVEDTAKC